jgi:2-polyprenyl-3-methyl-5-hydroxy-6-metoxy-1,4-benzoquinol methylase
LDHDGLLKRLEELGGPERVSVFDFGCGVAHSGLAFAAAGYRTVCVDVMREYLDFQQFMADVRGLEPVLIRAETEEDFYDTGSDGHEYGLVIEWSSFEHVRDARSAVEALTAGLVPGGYFVTTTFCKDWDARAARALPARHLRGRDLRGVPVAGAGSMAA